MEARTTRAFPMLGRTVVFEAIAPGLSPDLVRFVEGHPSQGDPWSDVCRGKTRERANFHADDRPGDGRRGGAGRRPPTNGKPFGVRDVRIDLNERVSPRCFFLDNPTGQKTARHLR